MGRLMKNIHSDIMAMHVTPLRDSKLAASERGILVTLLSLSNCDITADCIAEMLPDESSTVEACLKRLEAAGYLHMNREQNIYEISDKPRTEWLKEA